MARNLLMVGTKEEIWGWKSSAGSRGRAPVESRGEAPRSRRHMLISSYDGALILFIQTLALYKSFTYLLTYLLTCTHAPLATPLGRDAKCEMGIGQTQTTSFYCLTKAVWCTFACSPCCLVSCFRCVANSICYRWFYAPISTLWTSYTKVCTWDKFRSYAVCDAYAWDADSGNQWHL